MPKPITLSDGTVQEIPDGLDPQTENAYITRLDAANNSAKQGTINFNAPVQTTSPFDAAVKYVADRLPSAPAFNFNSVDTATGGALSSTADKISAVNDQLEGWPSATGKMAAHVGANLALGVPSLLAGALNTFKHAGASYGWKDDSPDLPIASQAVPAALGVTPEDTTAGKVTEALLSLASANKIAGAGPIWSAAKAPVQAGLQWFGSKIGGAIGGEPGAFIGGLVPGSIPLETLASKWIDLLPQSVRDRIRAPNAQDVVDATNRIGTATGNPDLTPTAGMVGGEITKGLEKSAMSFPGVNIPVLGARGRVAQGLKQGVDTAAQQLVEPGTNINTSQGGAGFEWQSAAQDQLTNTWRTAQDNIRQVEDDASSRNLTDANGNPQLVTGATLAALGARLRNVMGFDNQGRVISALDDAGDATVNGVINGIAGKLQDQDPVAGNNMRASLAAHQAALNSPNLPPGMASVLQDRIDQLNQNIAANKGVSFDTLRQHKSTMGNAAQQGDWVAGKVADALRDTLGDHLNAVDPALGKRYSDAVQAYNDAMNLNRSFTGAKVNAVGKTDEPGVYTSEPGDQTLTRRAEGLLENPQHADPYLNTPGFRNVLAAVVQGLGQKNDRFDPTQAAKDIGGITPQGEGLLTQLSAGPAGPSTVVPTLRNVRTAGDAFDLKPGPAGLSGALATTALAEGAAEKAGWLRTLLGGGAAAFGLERPGAIRAIAGVPQAWRNQLSIPALVQVANMQARNQGQ